MYLLVWNKCSGNVWCPFLTVDLSNAHFLNREGVYIIWHGGQTPWTVYVGQGNIAQRLDEHRRDPRILQYSRSGLFVTWADVPPPLRDGVERYLADQLQPREGLEHPQAVAIPVKYPMVASGFGRLIWLLALGRRYDKSPWVYWRVTRRAGDGLYIENEAGEK